jgi:hypothetical protein
MRQEISQYVWCRGLQLRVADSQNGNPGIKYLAANFGLNSQPRDLKLDPLVRDEAALAQAIYIQYEGLTGHDPAPSVENPGVVYLSDLFKNHSIVAIDTRLEEVTYEKRVRETAKSVSLRGNVGTGSYHCAQGCLQG